ncbi:hypothetical protein [Hymenobacter cellulosivorans]|uniref:Uncharacterized protein n=1 Tax=Hymenobacter cellulosivorans TaxID=2932249 RepID=A0ABY4F741_9BACT|nr:hypothetical protein [Hymenobacter cellulosivorans]UOQ51734.1 hypothetical protein MUN80_18455 [Hymenobacter cellulosivorans]
MRRITLPLPEGTPDLTASLALLKALQTGYAPALSDELAAYLNTKAPFVVSVARQYRRLGVAWPELLRAGQQALVRAWATCQGDQNLLDLWAAWQVRAALVRLMQEHGGGGAS